MRYEIEKERRFFFLFLRPRARPLNPNPLHFHSQSLCDAHIGAQLASLDTAAPSDAVTALRSFADAWADHCAATLMLRRVFTALDRAAAAPAPVSGGGGGRGNPPTTSHRIPGSVAGRPVLYDAGLEAFRAHLAAHPAVQARAVEGALALVDGERGGAPVDRALLRAGAASFVALGLYPAALEAPLLARADAAYAAEGDRLVVDLDAAAYLRHAEARLEEEAGRTAACLAPRTRRPLVRAVEARLLAAHLPTLLEKGFGPLADAGPAALPDLARLAAAARRVGGLDALRAAFKAWVRARGGSVMDGALGPVGGVGGGAPPGPGPAAAARPASGAAAGTRGASAVPAPADDPAAAAAAAAAGLVPGLLALKAAADAAVARAFAARPEFAAAAKDALEAVLNGRGGRPAELLAKYLDAELRGSGSANARSSDAGGAPPTPAGLQSAARPAGGATLPPPAAASTTEARLEAALLLFRHLQGKDVFEAFYKKDLAKRLLLGRSPSGEAERAVLARLKAECGPGFTAKLEGMFQDVDLSREVGLAFKASPQAAAAGAPPGLDLAVSILTAGYWPTYDPPVELLLPGPLSSGPAAFEAFYLAKHGGRKLTWQHALGTAVVRARWPSGARELSVSAYQAAVLLLFNEGGPAGGPDGAGLAALAGASGLPDGELRRTLQSLACGRVRPLLKHPKGRDVGDGDAFTWNAGFTASLFRLRINAIQLRETPAENAATSAAVAQDRAHAVDAAVVRIMKARRSLSHRLLVGELGAQLAFPLRPADLKKRLESLIDREYLARDAGDPNVYNYLA